MCGVKPCPYRPLRKNPSFGAVSYTHLDVYKRQEQYLQFMQKDAAAFREELREDATKKVVTRLILMSIVEAEKIEVTEEEREEELKNMAMAYNVDVDQIKEMIGDGMTYLNKDIQLKKVIDMLYDKAKVTTVEKKEEASAE